MTEDFPWGEIIKLHKIDGLPAIVEYKVGPDFHDPGAIQFSVTYKNSTSWSFDTLDEAILGALCDKNRGSNALWYAIRVLTLEGELACHFKLGSEEP